jgi:hypothetical protein
MDAPGVRARLVIFEYAPPPPPAFAAPFPPPPITSIVLLRIFHVAGTVHVEPEVRYTTVAEV